MSEAVDNFCPPVAIAGPSTSRCICPPQFQWESNLPHPLLIPHVARNIMERLDIKEVEMAREVCRDWNQEACSLLNDKKVVALLEVDAVKFYLQKMEATNDFPHTHFELHMDISEKQALMRTFWATFGSHIKGLDLRHGAIILDTLYLLMGERLPNLEKLHLRTLPRRINIRRNSHPPQQEGQAENVQAGSQKFTSLKELSLHNCPQDDPVTKSILKDLLMAFSNLEKLSLKDIPNVSGDGEVGNRTRISRLLVQNLTDLEVDLPNLKSIDFQLEVGNLELEGLTQKRFQFQDLSLKLTAGTKNSVLKDFLAMVSPSLKSLEVIFPVEFFTLGVTFPAYTLMKSLERAFHLKQVKELNLVNFQGSLNFIKKLDRLERLSINKADFTSCLGVPRAILPEDRFCVGVDHKLMKFQTDSLMTDCAVRELSMNFPLLRILQVTGIDDNGLGIIYRNLPYLVKLEISEGKCTDQGISGVPKEICDDMAETATYKCVNPEKYRRDLFVGSLPYLKTLKMASEEMTDISIAFGIVDCKNLEYLTLQSSVITDAGMQKIADRMLNKLKFFDIGHCESVSEAGKFYVKERMKGVKLVLEPCGVQRIPRPDNPYRQVGLPFRGHVDRHLDRELYIAAMDEDYERLSLRERMMADRRRRIHNRFLMPLRSNGPRHPAIANLVRIDRNGFLLSDEDDDDDDDVYDNNAMDAEEQILQHHLQEDQHVFPPDFQNDDFFVQDGAGEHNVFNIAAVVGGQNEGLLHLPPVAGPHGHHGIPIAPEDVALYELQAIQAEVENAILNYNNM